MAISQQLKEHKLKGNNMIEVTLKDSTTISAADYSATQHYLQIEDTTIPLAEISRIDVTQGVGLKAFWEDELEWLAVQGMSDNTNGKLARAAYSERSQDVPTITAGLVAL
jgi:hypothetical protein